MTQRAAVVRQAAEEESKQKAEAGKIDADHQQKMGELALAAMKEQQQLQDSARHMTDQERAQEDTNAANQEYALKMTAFSQQIAALDKNGKDYENKLRELQNKQKELTQQHENEITAIKDRAAETQNQHGLAMAARFQDEVASGLTKVIMGHQSFAQMMGQIGNQLASSALQTAIKMIEADDLTKIPDAASAARSAFLAGMKFPFPANIVMAPTLAASAFETVMGFEGGGIVPGVGRGDIVPAMLAPGEGVVPGGVMEKIAKMPDSGGGSTYHVHVRPVYHLQALDGDGIAKVLDKHSGTLEKHFHNAVRKLNR